MSNPVPDPVHTPDEVPAKLRWLNTAITLWGFPTVAICLMGFLLFLGARWAATEVGKPLVVEHVKFLDTQIETARSIGETQGKISEAIKQLAESRERLQQNSLRQIELLDTMNSQMRTDHIQQAVNQKSAADKLESIENRIKKPQ